MIKDNKYDVNKGKSLSDREKVLKRTFKMYCRRGLYGAEDFHDFCKHAKGKSESKLIEGLLT